MAYTEKRTGGYVGRYRVDGRLKSTRVFKSKRDAQREADAQERAGKSSEWIDPKASAVTLADYFELWHGARSSKAARTRETERERFDSLIAPAFGRTPLKRLDHAEIARWADSMASAREIARATSAGERPVPASQARRRDAVRLLVQILDSATDAQRIRRNPARLTSGKVPFLPRASRTKAHRYLTHEQLRRVVSAAGSDQASALVLLTGLTGLRWGEVSALTVGDLNLTTGRVSVSKAYTRLSSGQLLLGDTKTHARREVPIGAALRNALATQAAGKRRADLLFSTSGGEPLRRESFSRNSFEPAVRAAGHAVSALQQVLNFEPTTVSHIYDASTEAAVRSVQERHGLPASGICTPDTWSALIEEDRNRRDGMTQGQKVSRTRQLQALARTTLAPGAEDFESLTLHDLRHTAASLAVAHGAHVKTVQKMLGHESAKLTLDTYAGLFEPDLDELGADLSAAYEASAAHSVLTDPAPSVAGVATLSGRKRA
jgi:integrase